MTTDPGRDLAAHGAALRGLARALVGGDDAEDLLQDGYAAVLQAGRGDIAEPGSWLAAVLRRLAGKRLRRRRLERRHLAAEPSTRAPAAPSAAEQAARREQIARLDAELLSLPEPYRATLIARYYESLAPTAIAARDRVPVATVKSRLARGLALMRERFDADRNEDSDWRAGLVTAFGLERTAAAGEATAIVTGGVLLMGTWTKAFLAIAAASVLAWFGWHDEAPIGRGGAAAREADAAPIATDAPPPPQQPLAVTRSIALPRPATAVGDSIVVVGGRCVDEHGAPLPGVVVAATYRDPWEFAEHVLAAPTTGADGRYEASFAPPPARAVQLRFTSEGRVPVGASLRIAETGGVHELGDTSLEGGVALRGALVDDHGAPVAARVVPIELDLDRTPTPLFAPADADASGAFSLRLFPGEYRLTVPGQMVVDGGHLVVPEGSSEATARITVRSGLPRIRGVVVDDAGIPVAGAEVAGEEPAVGGRYTTRTNADGSFVMLRDVDGAQGDVVVRAKAPGLEHVRYAQDVAWDTAPIRIELPASQTLEVRVVHAVTNAPVEDFAVRLVVGRLPQDPPTGRFAGADVRPQAFDVPRMAGHHPGGVLFVPDLRRDVHALRVEPLDPTLSPSAVQLVTVDGDQRTLLVALWPTARREVVLAAADGAAISGCRVELCDPFRGEVTLRSYVAGIAELSRYQVPDLAVLVASTESDAAGSCALTGPGGRDLALRVLGPGCIPHVVQRVRLDAAQPLRIIVDPGATLRVDASPADVLAQLEALSDAARTEGPAVGLRLRASTDRRITLPASRSAPAPFGDEASAELRGVPPGVFDVELEWRVGDTGERRHIGQVTLASGRTTTLRVELDVLRPATFEGTVRLNGEPLANRAFELRGERQHRLRTDAAGRFRFRGAPGSYRLALSPDEQRAELVSAPVELRPGQTASASFDLRAAPLSLRFIDEQGRPVDDVHEARLLRAAGEWAATFPDSDAEGRTALPAVDAGTMTLRVMPRRLASIEAKQRHLAEHPEDQDFAAVDLDLGQVVVEAGRDNATTVVLPAAYWR